MEIVDKYGSHYVPADYFTRGDHIENDHIHFPTGVETHNVASDAELLTAVQQLEAQVNTKADQTTLQSQGAVLQGEIDANELTHQNDVLGLQGEIDTNETNIVFNTQRNQEQDEILQHSDATMLAQYSVHCDVLDKFTDQNCVISGNFQVLADETDVPDNGLPPGLVFDRGVCTERLNLLEDGRVVLAPAADALYRFGSEDAQTGADRDEYDGLHMYSGLALENDGTRSAVQPDLNEIEIKVAMAIPTVEITATKDPDVAIVLVRDNDGDEIMELLEGELKLHARDGKPTTFGVYKPNTRPAFTVANDGKVSVVQQEDNVFKSPVVMNGLGAPLVVRACNAHNAALLELRDNTNTVVWEVLLDGTVRPAHEANINLPGAQPAGQAPMNDSAGVGDNSLYIGSTRLSYDRVLHRMEFHRLKLSHVPIYLQGRGMTSSHMPTGHVVNDMSAMKWVQQARAHLSEPALTLHDVFPIANTGDWELADAPADGMSADISTLESEMDSAEAAILLRAPLDDPTFTTNVTTPLIHTSQVMSQNSHLKIGSQHTNDLNIFLTGQETLQITRTGTECRYQSHGSTGQHRFMNKVYGDSDFDIAGSYLVNGSDLLATERSRIDSILNLSSADLDTFKEIEDAYKAADSSLTTTVTNLTSTAAADRALIRQELAAADTVVRNFAVTSTATEASTRAAADTALDGRLDVLEAIDYGTQAELDVEKLRITAHATLHVQHTSALADKINTTGHQTMDGRLTVQNDGSNGVVANPHADDLQVYHYGDCGITCGAPEGKIGTLAFSDQNKADRNQLRAYSTVRDSRNIGMHFLANQAESAVPSMSVCSQVVGINNAQPTYALDVTGDVNLTGDIRINGTVQSFGGGTTTFLSQVSDPATATYRGEFDTAQETSTHRTLSSTETEIVVWDEASSSDNASIQLPPITGLSAGHTINVHNFGNNISVYVFQNPADNTIGNRMYNAWAWSGSQTSVSGTRAVVNESYRFTKFILTQRSSTVNGSTLFWFVMNYDTTNA